MIEHDLEKIVVDKLSGLGLASCDVFGMWQPAASGVVKGAASQDALAALSVVCSPRQFETFSTPVMSVQIALALSVRAELCKNGAELSSYMASLMDVLTSWQRSIDAVKSDFKTSIFTPAGFRLDGGDVGFDDGKHAWSVTQSFTIRGIMKGE